MNHSSFKRLRVLLLITSRFFQFFCNPTITTSLSAEDFLNGVFNNQTRQITKNTIIRDNTRVFHKDSIGVLYAYSIHVSVMLSGTVNALNFHLNASYMPTASSFGSENAKHFSEMYNTSMTRAFPSTKRFSSTKTRFEVRKNKGNVAQPSWKNRAKKYLFCIFQLLFLLSITSSMRTKRGRKVVLDARENSLAHAE